ncbi:hypothetical protein IDJ77_14405 [Mucilaginibacter sp. ZT4R22]|uniref:Glycosyltransferase involved in cell wall biosynthesis n=1 Tax=Mucilaginibacter pankratovii TaxID=2772110 RepID=A0ABR7WRR5_9SPHI|nr:hypothetical protein [Mucilaginibacter pankratovii]MBD1365009.1 hypothetical protein [Mucilaginibacter pankratovii]
MIKRKICLFTAHSPKLGGGGAILRSLVANLPDLDILWTYIGNSPVDGYEDGYLGPALMGGPLLKDILQTRQMLSNSKLPFIDNIIKKLLAIDCDGYWIVSHNEGLRIAIELSTRQTERPVHMTVHDDWAGALCARSLRYRFMAGAAQKLTITALKTVPSFDLISGGMRDHYRKLSARRGEVCHRYLPESAILAGDKPDNKNEVLVGHIGSIYDKKDLFNFITLLKEFYQQENKKVTLQMWGCHLKPGDVPQPLQDNIKFYDTLPEDKVVPELAKCDFVYCMYPLGKALRTFSKTSLPTKLSSYLQAARPIFGHGPADSTLAEFLGTTKLGGMWSVRDKQTGFKALEMITALNPGPEQWQEARRLYFGEKNLQVMNKALNSREISGKD